MEGEATDLMTAKTILETYPPNIKRKQVIELGRQCGLSAATVRSMIDGADALVKPRLLGGQRYGYFSTQEVVDAFFPDSTK